MSRTPTPADYALASDLAKIYMQKQPSPQESPVDFTKRYIDTSSQIFHALLTNEEPH